MALSSLDTTTLCQYITLRCRICLKFRIVSGEDINGEVYINIHLFKELSLGFYIVRFV